MATSDHTTPLKRCTKCGNDFPATPDYFPRNTTRKSVLGARCHLCNRKHVADSRKADPDGWRERKRLEYQRNKDKYLERAKRQYQQKPETNKLAVRRYQMKHIDRVRAASRNNSQKRRAYKRSVEASCTKEDIQLQLKTQNDHCWWCGKRLGTTYHVDHRIPLSRGGMHTANNIVITHPECNLSKSNKMPWEWNGRLL